MSEEILLTVNPDGTIDMLGDTAAAHNLFGDQIASAQQRRASHVQPVNRALRGAFRVLRRLFGETGRVARFTRVWPCHWQADMAPSGGPILGPFAKRQDAICAEISWLCAGGDENEMWWFGEKPIQAPNS